MAESSHGAGKGGVEASQRTHHTKAVGADDTEFSLARPLSDLLLQLDTRRPAFLEPGRNDDGPFDARLDTFRDNIWHGGCGRGNDSEINPLWQDRQIGVGFDTQNAGTLWIDG